MTPVALDAASGRGVTPGHPHQPLASQEQQGGVYVCVGQGIIHTWVRLLEDVDVGLVDRPEVPATGPESKLRTRRTHAASPYIII
jgi:hypothetical protein